MRRVLAAALLALGVVPLAACGPSPSPEPTAPQGAPVAASYTFVLDSSCGERALIGRYAVTVEDSVVTAVEGLPSSDPQVSAAAGELVEDVPTINELTNRASSTEHVSELSFDPVTGLLMSVTFDGNPDAIDDEECYQISDYSPTT